MPDSVNTEATEIEDSNQLTVKKEDDTIKQLQELHSKVNDYYLRPRPPLNTDPVFELFDKLDARIEE